jgi:outer membrane usher protein FimD/PapC
MDFSIFSSFLPEGLLSYFDIVDFKELSDLQIKKDCLYIYLDEKNILPKDYASTEFESKGFYERSLIQDFPIRGKAVYLGIGRRRWRNKNDKSIAVKSDYSFIAERSKLTVELSDFLKDTGILENMVWSGSVFLSFGANF